MQSKLKATEDENKDIKSKLQANEDNQKEMKSKSKYSKLFTNANEEEKKMYASLKALVNIEEDDSVLVSVGGATIVAGLKSAVNYIGTVFEIYTKNSDGNKKKTTAADDLVVIDMAGI